MMTFDRVIKKTWNENILFTALVELTYRCNLNCYYCYNDLKLTGRPLTAEQYYRFFADLHDLGTMDLIFTGGEPLAHPDFFWLGRKARALGFVIKIKSNGYAVRGTLARRIKEEIDPFLIEISLHGASPESHDRQTQVAGSFDRLVANIAELRDLSLRIKLNCTLTAWNEHEVEAIYALADGLGIPLHVDCQISPRDDGDPGPLSIKPSAAGIQRLFRLQFGRPASPRPSAVRTEDETAAAYATQGPRAETAATDKQCGAGSSGIAVDPYGNVYPCVQWRRVLGNLHRQSIKEIWRGSPALDEVRRLTGEAKRLVDGFGSKGKSMAYCAGLAELSTGKPVTIYPAARLRMELFEDATKRQKESRSGVGSSPVHHDNKTPPCVPHWGNAAFASKPAQSAATTSSGSRERIRGRS